MTCRQARITNSEMKSVGRGCVCFFTMFRIHQHFLRGDLITVTCRFDKHTLDLLLSSQNMSDAMAVLHKLQTGLDVNVKFTGVRVFEYTPECIVFDLLDIPLYHGWLVDPQVRPVWLFITAASLNSTPSHTYRYLNWTPFERLIFPLFV